MRIKKSAMLQPQPFEEKNVVKTTYQVLVGSYGVIAPKEINVETLDGLTLVTGTATPFREDELHLAKRIAMKTGGKLFAVTELFKRELSEIDLDAEGY